MLRDLRLGLLSACSRLGDLLGVGRRRLLHDTGVLGGSSLGLALGCLEMAGTVGKLGLELLNLGLQGGRPLRLGDNGRFRGRGAVLGLLEGGTDVAELLTQLGGLRTSIEKHSLLLLHRRDAGEGALELRVGRVGTVLGGNDCSAVHGDRECEIANGERGVLGESAGRGERGLELRHNDVARLQLCPSSVDGGSVAIPVGDDAGVLVRQSLVFVLQRRHVRLELGALLLRGGDLLGASVELARELFNSRSLGGGFGLSAGKLLLELSILSLGSSEVVGELANVLLRDSVVHAELVKLDLKVLQADVAALNAVVQRLELGVAGLRVRRRLAS